MHQSALARMRTFAVAPALSPEPSLPYFLFDCFAERVSRVRTASAPILANPSTTLERLRMAFGQIVPAASSSSARSSADIFTVTEVVLLAIHPEPLFRLH